MAYGPVNVPGGSGGSLSVEDLNRIDRAVKDAQDAAREAKEAVAKLERSIEDGTLEVKTKAVFRVVDADPENPEQGDAWILTNPS